MPPVSLQILHNPRCGKSRQACALANEQGAQTETVEYLKHPLTAPELRALVKKLGIPAEQLLRKGEAIFKAEYATQTLDDEAAIAAMVAHPILMERPVIIRGERAVIGRPPERLLELLDPAS